MIARCAWILLAAVLGLAGTACGGGEPASESGTIAAADLAERIADGDAPFVLDVRTEQEFQAGHIPGAVNIPHTDLAARMGELPADRGAEIVVHCQSGRRAQAAEAELHEAGFTRVLDLEGHMAGWREGNHPIE